LVNARFNAWLNTGATLGNARFNAWLNTCATLGATQVQYLAQSLVQYLLNTGRNTCNASSILGSKVLLGSIQYFLGATLIHWLNPGRNTWLNLGATLGATLV